MAETEMEQIIVKLDSIKTELDFIKTNMVSVDAILNEDDKKAITQGKEEYKLGKTISFEDLKRKLKVNV